MTYSVHRMVLMLGAVCLLGCGERRSVATGRLLFSGQLPLVALLAGDDVPLPVQASRCINCHLRSAAPAVNDGGDNTQTFGPPLTARGLTEPQRRRGGPPSRYDVDRFCALLKTGVDPAHVLVARTMPRYQLTPSDCRALWDYLTAGP